MPFLNTRHNDVHTEISTSLAFQILEQEGGDEDIVIPAIILHDTVTSKQMAADKLSRRAKEKADRNSGKVSTEYQ